MPILNNPPKDERPSQDAKPNESLVTEENYDGVTVDSQYVSRQSMLTHIQGSPWTVNYYRQMLGSDSELSPQQMEKHAVYQQYMLIADLELRVTSPLDSSQRQEGNSFDVNGEAYVYPPLVPNKGDMFLADVGDGREGVFAVTGAERLTILKESCFRITYTLVDWSTDERRKDFDNKTVKRTHFVKRLLTHGQDPIVVDETYHEYLSFDQYANNLFVQFFSEFYDKATSTLIVPDQENSTYDPFLTKTMAMCFNTTDHPMMRQLHQYSVEIAGKEIPKTVWDCVVQGNLNLLPMTTQTMTLLESYHFGSRPQLEGIYYSNVHVVVYPLDQSDVQVMKGLVTGTLSVTDLRHRLRTPSLGRIGTVKEGQRQTPLIHPTNIDDFYVLSEAFYYQDREGMSVLERLLSDALNGQSIDHMHLSELCQNATYWGRVERFYYIPLLLVLLKFTLRGQ